MTDKTLTSTLRIVALAASLATIGGPIFLAVNGQAGISELGLSVVVASFGTVIWLVAPNQPRNALFWVLSASLLGFGLWVTGEVVIRTAWPSVELPVPDVSASLDIPTAVIVIERVRTGLIAAGLLSLLTFGLLLFPDGHLPSPRWRWFGYFCGVGIVALAGGIILGWTPGGVMAPTAWEFLVSLFVWLGPPACLVSLIMRYRRSDAQTKTRVKWIVWGASLFVPLTISSMFFSDAQSLAEFLFAFALVILAISYAIGVTRHRLFDIDVVISRTLVYGALAVFIGAVYVGIVVGIGTLVGDPGTSTWLQILATVVIAIAFQPLRRRLQRVANRFVFGRSATPYEVLSSFSQAVSAVDPAVLTEVARSLADGTTARSASIWARRADHLHCIAAWPELPGEGFEPSSFSEPVLHEGEELGVVTLDIPAGQPFPTTDQRLLEQVASGLGLALRNLQLTDDLKDRVEELAASRRRIVAVQDETRRRLERDLHDGAQQRLVSLKIKLGIGASMAEQADLDDVKSMLDEVRGETDQTIEAVRDFARGIYPPLLEAEGLGPALRAQAMNLPIPVTVRDHGLGRYPKEQEATVYFCVLEALQNAMKHSQASSVEVDLNERNGSISFQVGDDGVGFDLQQVVSNGLINMRDRVEAAGGNLRVESSPGDGVTITGRVPVDELVAT